MRSAQRNFTGCLTMKITVKLIASLSAQRFKTEVYEYPPGTLIRQVAEDLSIPMTHIGIVLVNEKHSSLDTVLDDGDNLLLLPMMDGG